MHQAWQWGNLTLCCWSLQLFSHSLLESKSKMAIFGRIWQWNEAAVQKLPKAQQMELMELKCLALWL